MNGVVWRMQKMTHRVTRDRMLSNQSWNREASGEREMEDGGWKVDK